MHYFHSSSKQWCKTSTRHFPNSLMVKQDQRLLVSFTLQCQESQGSTPSLTQCLAIMLHHAVHPTSLQFPPTAQSQGRWFTPESGPWRECTRDGEEADMRVCSAGLPMGLSLLQPHLCRSHVESSQNCPEGVSISPPALLHAVQGSLEMLTLSHSQSHKGACRSSATGPTLSEEPQGRM